MTGFVAITTRHLCIPGSVRHIVEQLLFVLLLLLHMNHPEQTRVNFVTTQLFVVSCSSNHLVLLVSALHPRNSPDSNNILMRDKIFNGIMSFVLADTETHVYQRKALADHKIMIKSLLVHRTYLQTHTTFSPFALCTKASV